MMGNSIQEANAFNILQMKTKAAANELFSYCLAYNNPKKGFEANFELAGYVNWVEFDASTGDRKLSFDRIFIHPISKNHTHAVEELNNSLTWLTIATKQLQFMHRDWLQETNKEITHVST